MKLLGFEIKKVARNQSVVILLLLLVIVNVILGAITKTESRTEDYPEFFENHIADISYSAKINYLLIDDKSTEESYYQADIVKQYEKLSSLDVRNEVRGYSTVLISSYPYLSALFVCMYIAMMLSNEEHNSNLTLLTYKNMRRKICLAKLAFIVAASITTVILFALASLLGSIIINGCSGILSPIQAIPEYIGSPYHINVLIALISRICLSILVVLAISLCVFIISILCKKIIYALIGICLLFGIDYILVLLNDGLFDYNNLINISEFLTDVWLRQYSGMKIFCFLSQLELFAIVCVITISVLIITAVLTFRYVRSIQNIKNKRNAKCKQDSVKSAFYYEIKKLLPGKTIGLIICLLGAHIFLTTYTTNAPYRDWDNVYRYNLYQMKDMCYEQQLDYSQKVKNEAYASIINAQNIKDLYFNDEETYDNYLAAQQASGAAELQLSVFETIDEQLMTVKKLRDDGIETGIVYSTGWKMLFAGAGDIILLVSLIILIIPYLTIENACNYDKILASIFITDKRAKRRFESRKIWLLLVTSFVLIITYTIADLVVTHIKYGLPSCFSYAAGAGIAFDNIHIRLFEAVILKVIFSSAATYTLIMLAQSLKRYIRKALPLIAFFVVSLGIAHAISELLDSFFVFDVLSLFSVQILYDNFYSSLIKLSIFLLFARGLYTCKQINNRRLDIFKGITEHKK